MQLQASKCYACINAKVLSQHSAVSAMSTANADGHLNGAMCQVTHVSPQLVTLNRASSDPSKAFESEPSRPCTQAGISSGQALRVPRPTMTAMLVPTVCRNGLEGLEMLCRSESCTSPNHSSGVQAAICTLCACSSLQMIVSTATWQLWYLDVMPVSLW